MKRIIAIAMILCVTVSLFVLSPSAAAADAATVQQTISALGIMVGDENGNMNLTNNVTRAEFVKMMVAASSYRDSIGGGSNLSLFKDVKSTYWGSEYIKLAVENGWVVGYVDGTFKPDKTVTLEEAASALLRMLGYTADDLKGSYPTAQLSKFKALGLGDEVTKTQGQSLTRSDCMQIFYNLMTADTSSGSVYATTVGYTLNTAGELNYSTIVEKDTKGPYVLTASTSAASLLPFSGDNITVYKNGKLSTLSAAATYDVMYYNSNLRTVWLYRNMVTGTLTKLSPDSSAPTSATVSGNSYTIGTSSAAYKLSSAGAYPVGSTVTLLLGKDGSIADVISAGTVDNTSYGVVVSKDTGTYTDSDGKTVTENYVDVVTTSGVVGKYGVGSASLSVGTLVSVSYSGTQSGVKTISKATLSGTVNATGTKLGDRYFSDDIEIIETNSSGDYATVYASRLAGAALTNSQVSYYVLNQDGEICKLILNDTTGDLYSYGLLTGVSESSSGMNVSGTYKYILGGVTSTLNSSNQIFGVSVGAAEFRYEDGAISKLTNLTGVTLTSLGSVYATGSNKQFKLSEGVQVYEKQGDSYFLVNVEKVSDTSAYTLYGYYDSGRYAAGGLIRVIVATAK